MTIKAERPPIYDEIVERLGTPPPTAVFAWGDVIYAPAGEKSVSGDLIVHEMVHRHQQELIGSPELWWERYLDDRQFRLDQEVEAYRAQIAIFPSRDLRRQMRKACARQLASAMYRLGITESEARRLLSMSHVVAEAA